MHERVSGLDTLNCFARDEIAAIETYQQALEHPDLSPEVRSVLEVCLRSHERRATELIVKIRRMGGEPVQSSGIWGGFARLVEGGAKLLGPAAAIDALREGESLGTADYRRMLPELPGSLHHFVATKILPEQEHTAATLARLQVQR